MSEEQQRELEEADVESHAQAGAGDEPAAEEENEVEAHIMREP